MRIIIVIIIIIIINIITMIIEIIDIIAIILLRVSLLLMTWSSVNIVFYLFRYYYYYYFFLLFTPRVVHNTFRTYECRVRFFALFKGKESVVNGRRGTRVFSTFVVLLSSSRPRRSVNTRRRLRRNRGWKETVVNEANKKKKRKPIYSSGAKDAFSTLN